MKRTPLLVAAALSLGLVSPAFPQTSANYKLTESVINNGGDPAQGTFGTSAHYRIRLDAIGDVFAGTGLSSANQHIGAGFVGRYPPPGEVLNVRFTSKTMLTWN